MSAVKLSTMWEAIERIDEVEQSSRHMIAYLVMKTDSVSRNENARWNILISYKLTNRCIDQEQPIASKLIMVKP